MADLNEAQEREQFEADARKQGYTVDAWSTVGQPIGSASIFPYWLGWLAGVKRASAQQVEAVSIDTLEFRRLMWTFKEASSTEAWAKTDGVIEQVIAHINSKLRPVEAVSAEGLDALLSPQDRAHFARFMECCEDFDSGGHDVPKAAMSRLIELGVVRRSGGMYFATALGHYIREGKDRPTLPLATFNEINERNRVASLAQQGAAS